MPASSSIDRYVVIGNPIAHSLSPAIHARFAEQTREAIAYERMLVPRGEFAAHARRFFSAGGAGANVTLPFKVDAFEFADSASERARAAGAANFLAARDGHIEADNTDGAGLVRDLEDNLGIAIAGARVLLVGAGGAARGVVTPILARLPAALVIANRTLERARELAQRFGDRGAVEAVALDAISGERFDLVLNATSASVQGEAAALPEAVFAPGAFVYDMAYGPAADAFLARARERQLRAADGLGMLVEQAAESFFLWRGKRPETAPVIRELRSSRA